MYTFHISLPLRIIVRAKALVDSIAASAGLLPGFLTHSSSPMCAII
jgi:hypothetical protein